MISFNVQSHDLSLPRVVVFDAASFVDRSQLHSFDLASSVGS